MTNEQDEISRKRKNSQENLQIPNKHSEEEDNDFLTLSLSFRPIRPRRQPQPQPPPPPPQPSLVLPSPAHQSLSAALLSQAPPPGHHPLQLSPAHPLYMPSIGPSPPLPIQDSSPNAHNSNNNISNNRQEAGPSRPLRARRNPTQAPREGKSETIPAPFPWATTHRATVHSLDHLLSKQIFSISGDVQCKRCERRYEMEYDLREKFVQVGTFIAENKSTMHDRAPGVWMNPVLPTCKFCEQENSVKPVISENKKSINWLFLLLGQMLGCCTLEQLKYFCKHTKNHRTGAKDRVLYLTYLGLCKQLDPNGPFDR